MTRTHGTFLKFATCKTKKLLVDSFWVTFIMLAVREFALVFNHVPVWKGLLSKEIKKLPSPSLLARCGPMVAKFPAGW